MNVNIIDNNKILGYSLYYLKHLLMRKIVLKTICLIVYFNGKLSYVYAKMFIITMDIQDISKVVANIERLKKNRMNQIC